MKLDEALSFPDGPRRTAAIAAWVQSLFTGDHKIPALVGGAAVEILTGGAYTTGDFDFVGAVLTSVRKTLESNGFKKTGRHWINDDKEIFLEFPGEALDPKEMVIQREAFGYDVVMISLEDLLVDRLGAWEYWTSGVDGANSFFLYRACLNEIDQDRLTRRAREEGFEKALEALRDFHAAWTTSEPDSETLESWANIGPRKEKP